MSQLLHIADRVLNRPLLITRDKAQVIMSVLGGRIGIDATAFAPDANRFEGEWADEKDPHTGKRTRSLPYKVTKDGTAIITITGSLVNRGAWIGTNSGLTSYEGIQHQIKSAMNDPNVHSVIFDMHTPGGEAVGAFETADAVRQLSKKKRTRAVVNGMAASAGYAIASGADEIIVSETGVAGSIGVVLLHADFSRALANEGINPTLIFAGAHKVDGNPFEALSQEVRADLQGEVNAFYDLFIKTVSKGRGNRMSAAAARKTEARTYIGQAAVDVGLADAVGSFETVLAELSRASGRTTTQPRRSSMRDNNGAPDATNDAGISQADHNKAVSDARTAGKAEGVAEGKKLGATEERGRIAAIVGHASITGNAARLVAALDLAVASPDMSAESVAAFAAKNIPAAPAAEALAAPAAALGARAALPDSLAATGQQADKAASAPSWEDIRKKNAARNGTPLRA